MAGTPYRTTTPAITVRPLDGEDDRRRFTRFPWKVYEGDPRWVPPLLIEAEEFIDPKRHPFYRHGAAGQFLAWRDGEVVGRIGASEDPRYNEQHGSGVGCFGLFESIDDVEVAHALLDTAADWLRGRGLTSIRGPVDYSVNYLTGLLIDGFDEPARVSLNYQPHYYRQLLESWGLEKARDVHTWWLDRPPPIEGWQRILDRLDRHAIRIRPMRRRDLASEIARCELVFNEAWGDNWGFVSLTDAELEHYGRKLADFMQEDLCLVAEHEGEAIAFSLTLPEINEAIKPLNGRLTRWGLPLGLLTLLWRRGRLRTCFFFAMGVRHRFRRRGVAEALVLRTMRAALRRGYTGVEMGWTLEDNVQIERMIEHVGATRLRTFRVYERPL
jgi:GNAT superfamily N-acetyltransferase